LKKSFRPAARKSSVYPADTLVFVALRNRKP
jgi:hypothetical protein